MRERIYLSGVRLLRRGSMSDYTIKGTVRYIERQKIYAPMDGAHVAGKDGYIKGVHSVWLDSPEGISTLLPKGQVGFYYPLTYDMGLKVFYSFAWWKPQKEKYVRKMFKKHKKLAQLGLAPQVYDIVKVKLELDYPREGKKIRTKAYGYTVSHVHVNSNVWRKYAEGYPYEFGDGEHTPDGYKRFVAEVKKTLKENKIKMDCSYKIGDTLWCNARKRWFIVDISD